MDIRKLYFTFLFGTLMAVSSTAQWITSYSGTPAPQFDIPYIYILSAVDSNVVWAALARGYDDFSANRFLRTFDGGESWQEGTIPDSNMTSYTINIFGMDSLTAWATRVSLPEENSFVYKTTDGGMNWTEKTPTYSNDTVIMIAIHFFNPLDGVVYAETHDGTDWHVLAYYTSDGGDNWELANTPYLAGERIFIWHGNNNYSVQGDTMWFGTSLSRVFRSVDKGHNWEAFTVPFYHTRPIESVAFLDADNGIVATALSDSLGGSIAANDALRTDDGGETWTHIPIPNEIFSDPRMVGLAAIPGSNGAYMMYGYLQSNFQYKQMVSLDHGMTWNYVDGPESKTRCLQFISPTQGWGGGFDYVNLQTNIVEKIYKWSGPALLGGIVNINEEWNRLQAAVELWPNPAIGEVSLQIQDSKDENYLAEIFDMDGKLLFSENLKSKTPKTISVESWPVGAYILKVSGNGGITARTLLKQ